MKLIPILAWSSALLSACFFLVPNTLAEDPSALRVLFLGDNGPHRPEERFKQLQPVLAPRNIEVVYTPNLEELNPARLAGYDCVLIYANHTRISPEQERALMEFVEAGGGLAPIHCASYCFHNSPKYIEMVGAQFKSHGTGVFKETIVAPDHPIMQGLSAVESWDETYVHARHNPDRVVLAERREGDHAEPWTWVRTQGKGRVFYTAWGHDQRTWGNSDFQTLVERGIRWASANSPTRLSARTDLPSLEQMAAPAPLPNYVAGARWGTLGEPIRTMQKPLSPEESMRRFVTLPGFETSLFAADPEITKPIWMGWDERGRLWIAETVDYPNELQPQGSGRDRIKICEDTNGDGRADKFTIFADQLSIPTSFIFSNGGLIVVQAPDTLFLKDTTGDDRADVRKVLFTGWGTNDTHAGPSNLRYGFDNWVWGVVGYSGFRGTVGGRELRFGQGFFRFKPDGSQLEFVRSSNNNTWGLGLSEEGIIFGSTANNNASMYMPVANRYYETVRGWSASRLESIADSQNFYPIVDHPRQVDWHGRYTAGAGSALYTARSFPEEYWNKVKFVTEPTGHLIGKFHIEPRGADFISYNGRNFAASDDSWSSPIVAEVGPDGALWVIDWYNYIIQHNPTPAGFETGKGNAYETPLRDKQHGRIYRVAWTGAAAGKTAPAIKSLAGAMPRDLVAALRSDNLLWRSHAQRLLVERGQADVVPALSRLVADPGVDAIGLNPAAIHALWTLQGLGALQDDSSPGAEVAVTALKHPSSGVRRTAVAVLPRTTKSLEIVLRGKVLEDADAQVRLAALLALSEMPAQEEAGGAIFTMLQDRANAEDRWIPDAATAAAARHDAGFLKAVLSSFKPEASDSEQPAAGNKNLIANPSFENERDGQPLQWQRVTYGGNAEHQLAEAGRSGKRSARISSARGSDASWSMQVPVQPQTEYRLTGWIRTENLQRVGNGRGALFNIHELQDPERGATRALTGDTDWTQVELNFNSGALTAITVNALFGGWGAARGTAWFDDVELVAAGTGGLAGEVGRVVRLVTAHYAQRGPVESIVPTLAALKNAPLTLVVPVLDGLVSGWPQDLAPALSESHRKALADLMTALPEAARDRLLALGQRWGRMDLFGENVEAIIVSLVAQVRDESASDEKRAAAAKRLVSLDDALANVESVLKPVTIVTPLSLGTGLVNALTESRSPETAQAIISHWNHFSPAVRRAAINTLMRRPDWAASLLTAVEKGTIKRPDLSAEHWSQLRQNPNRTVASLANRLASTRGATSADRDAAITKLLPISQMKGDLARGREVFAAACANCHIFNGAGGTIGPDLTGIGARDRKDILLEIIDPNRSVESNYRLWTVTTGQGDTFSGRLEAETQTSIEILDTTGQKHVVQRREIASLEGSELSIMPEGFEELPEEDLASLIEYLATGPL